MCSAISFIWFFASALAIYGLSDSATAGIVVYIILTILGCIGIAALEATTPRTEKSEITPLSKLGDVTFVTGYYMLIFISIAISIIVACAAFIALKNTSS